MNTKGVFSHKSDEWTTPSILFKRLNDIYEFTLDPCSTDENYLCDKHYTISDDGLSKSWEGETVFCNPPYSKCYEWVKKAYNEKCLTVMLLPVRTDTKWFHEFIYSNVNCSIHFIKGRLHFNNSKNGAPFPSMLVLFNNERGKI